MRVTAVPALTVVAEAERLQLGTGELAAAWVTVKVCSPTLMVPMRVWFEVLAAMSKLTLPLPLPLAPPVMVIQLTELTAAQVHEVPVEFTVTLNEPFEAVAAAVWLVC